MSASPATFFAALTNRAPAFPDRFRELHLDKGGSSAPALTTVEPRNPQGFWKRLKAMGPVGLARSSYQSVRRERAETIAAFKHQLAAQFGKPVAERVTERLHRSSKLTLSQARQLYSNAKHIHDDVEALNLKEIASAVTSRLKQTHGASADLEPVTSAQIKQLKWSAREQGQMCSQVLTRRGLAPLIAEAHLLVRQQRNLEAIALELLGAQTTEALTTTVDELREHEWRPDHRDLMRNHILEPSEVRFLARQFVPDENPEATSA